MPFGSWSMERECFDLIREVLPSGSTILELGSGWVTGELATHYNMISIEHDAAHVGKYPSRYIHAPLNLGWYDPAAIRKGLDGVKYDLLLVDGPTAIVIGNQYSRLGMLAHLDLFDSRVPIVLDDTERRPEQTLAGLLSGWAGRPATFYRPDPTRKGFCLI